MAQVEASRVLSVAGRSGTGQVGCEWHASGTAAEDAPGIRLRRWFHPDPTVRLVFGDHRLAGKRPEGSRQSRTGIYIAHAVCLPVLSCPLLCLHAGRPLERSPMLYWLIPGLSWRVP